MEVVETAQDTSNETAGAEDANPETAEVEATSPETAQVEAINPETAEGEAVENDGDKLGPASDDILPTRADRYLNIRDTSRYEVVDFRSEGDNNRTHFGHVYNYLNQYYHSAAETATSVNFLFSLTGLNSETTIVADLRKSAVARRQQESSHLPDHLDDYHTYEKVEQALVRHCLLRLARAFLYLDKIFAALFAYVIEAQDHADTRKGLERIRKDITRRQRKGARAGLDDEGIFLGDLGHYCEDLLKKMQERDEAPVIPGKKPETPKTHFEVTHADAESLLFYLQDGLELPYWKMMLDVFFACRANRTSMGSDMISLALQAMISQANLLRSQLQRVLMPTSVAKSIPGILQGIDRRIETLRDFTNSNALNAEDDDALFELIMSSCAKAPDREEELAHHEDTHDEDARNANQLSPILTALVMVTMILAFLPLVIGFATSWAAAEPGTKADADYWYNISSSVAVIMGNFVMVLPLLKGFWFSASYVIMWLWFAAGIIFASVSIAIYPLCNTGWSSLLAFFATIAGFGATLSITTAAGNGRLRTTRTSRGATKEKAE